MSDDDELLELRKTLRKAREDEARALQEVLRSAVEADEAYGKLEERIAALEAYLKDLPCPECEGRKTLLPWAPRGESRGKCQACNGDGSALAAFKRRLKEA